MGLAYYVDISGRLRFGHEFVSKPQVAELHVAQALQPEMQIVLEHSLTALQEGLRALCDGPLVHEISTAASGPQTVRIGAFDLQRML